MAFLQEQRVRVFRTRPDAKLPVRAHKTDAGMDFSLVLLKEPPSGLSPDRVSY